MKINNSIFKLYDIRGVYGEDFDQEFVVDFGRAIGSHFGGDVIIGKDGRESSGTIESGVVRGVRNSGANAITIGECSTPRFYFSVSQAGAKAGIMITASHNPGQYNGFKVVGANGGIIGGVELHEILESTPRVSGEGSLDQKNFRNEYVRRVLQVAPVSGLQYTMGIDASEAIQGSFKELSVQTGIRFEPEKRDGLVVCLDPDGDRIEFIENGRKIVSDGLLLALVEEYKFSRVVYGASFSYVVREKLRQLGIVAIKSRVGRIFMYENMQKHDADFGGEISGHYYFKPMNYLEAPPLMAALVLQMMSRRGKTLMEIIKPYIKYFKSEEISFPIKRAVFEVLEKNYNYGATDRTDGLTVEYINEMSGEMEWWFNLRESNTEPVMRLVVEAKSRQLLESKISELTEIIGR